MKILYTSLTFPGDVTDGAGQVFKEYYNRLSKNGHEITVLTGLWKNPILDQNIIQFKVSNKKIIGLFQFIYKSRKFLKKYERFFDVIHCNGHKSGVPVALLKKRFICTIHDVRCFEKKGSILERFIMKFVSKRASKILTDSYTVKEQIKKYIPKIDQNKIETLYVGIGENFYNRKEDPIVKRLKEIGKKKILLYLGRITEYKGVEHIIEAFNKLKKDFPDWRLIIGGEPDFKMEKVYQKWLHDFPEIVFFGYVPDDMLLSCYSHADLFVTYPNRGEGFGLTSLEAIACGTQVVCSDLPVFREIMGDLGRFVKPDSPDDLYEVLGWAFVHCNFFTTKLSEKYKWKNIIPKLEKIYGDFIGKK